MPFVLQINLSYSSVTDVGLLSLAGISCLQTLTVLHLQGLTPRGLAAALLACGGLTKVKLHLSLRSSLPEPLIKHVEARGCVFEWRDKVFQVYRCSGSCLNESRYSKDPLVIMYNFIEETGKDNLGKEQFLQLTPAI